MSQGYNLTIKQTTTAQRSTTASGTNMIKFRGEAMIRGAMRLRTVIAQGKAADKIDAMLRKGKTHELRCLFERAPANEDGKRGGEFLTVVDLPRAKKAA